MVFKGFTDENGNVIPVQGAGTVYNEEKNSLALGKDTSATGQDQLVFGRNNVADATKVEIVGGGPEMKHSIQDIYDASVGDEFYISIHNNSAGDAVVKVRKTNIEHPSYIAKPKKLEVLAGAFEGYSVEAIWLYDEPVGGLNLECDATNLQNTRFTTLWVSLNTNATILSNIRTLDWEGNEKLAGSLTVGTGITIGETSLSQAELIALKALLNS